MPPPLLMHHQKQGRPSKVTLPSESKIMSRRSGSLPLYGGHSKSTLVPEMWQRHSSSLQQCSSPITWYLRRPLKKILQNGALGNTVIIIVQGVWVSLQGYAGFLQCESTGRRRTFYNKQDEMSNYLRDIFSKQRKNIINTTNLWCLLKNDCFLCLPNLRQP